MHLPIPIRNLLNALRPVDKHLYARSRIESTELYIGVLRYNVERFRELSKGYEDAGSHQMACYYKGAADALESCTNTLRDQNEMCKRMLQPGFWESLE